MLHILPLNNINLITGSHLFATLFDLFGVFLKKWMKAFW